MCLKEASSDDPYEINLTVRLYPGATLWAVARTTRELVRRRDKEIFKKGGPVTGYRCDLSSENETKHVFIRLSTRSKEEPIQASLREVAKELVRTLREQLASEVLVYPLTDKVY
jgi:hypothetical protein